MLKEAASFTRQVLEVVFLGRSPMEEVSDARTFQTADRHGLAGMVVERAGDVRIKGVDVKTHPAIGSHGGLRGG